MKKCIFILNLILICISSIGQNKYNTNNIRNEIKVIIDSIPNDSSLILVDCGEKSSYNLYQQLKNKASITELLELTSHPQSNIRCYSFLILSEFKNIDLFPIVVNLFNDSAHLTTYDNCSIFDYSPNYKDFDFFIELATTNNYNKSKVLDNVETDYIDSLLIYNSKRKYSRFIALERIKPVEKRYARIKEIYEKEDEGVALIALAKYKKDEDIPIILNSINKIDEANTYEAISYFPNQAFIPLLKEKLNSFKFSYFSEKYFYKAIASYKNNQAKELLNIILKKIQKENDNKYKLDDFLQAIQSNIDTNYIDILYELWSYKYITPTVFAFLNSKDSIGTFEYTKSTMKDTIKLIQYPYGVYDRRVDTLLYLMIDMILKKDHSLGIEIINNNIKKIQGDLIFHVFAEEASKLLNKKFIEPLLNVVQNNNSFWICSAAAEALIAYKDIEINKKLITINKLRKNTSAGDEINKVLMDNKIK